MPTPSDPMEPLFFATPVALRAWFSEHHAGTTELLVGFWKKDSGTPSITWPESVDEALATAHESRFRQHPAAWAYFMARPASYRRAAISWVSNAKQPSTQERRLASLIDHSAREATLPQFTRTPPAPKAKPQTPR